MKSIVKAKISLTVLSLLVLLSIEISGQECICGKGTTAIVRTIQNMFSTRTITTCIGDNVSKSATSSNRLIFISEFATKLLNRNVTVKELEENKELLNGLLKGQIKTETETIDFTPVETIRETIIRENPDFFDLKSPENKFLWRRDLDGFDDAWEKYLKERNQQNLNPSQTNFLLRIGEEYLSIKSSKEAIKVLETVVKSNPELAEAQFKLGQANELAKKPNAAIKNYEKIINLQNTDIQIQKLANERLKELKPTP